MESNGMPYTSRAACWVVTDGKVGMENQCVGLAAALGLAPVVKRVKLRLPWRLAAPHLNLCLKAAFQGNGDQLEPPWPSILIATGRLSVPASLLVKAASGGETFTIQLQDPIIAPRHFDLVIVPEHDQLRGPNVLVTKGSLHLVTADKLASAETHWRHLFAAKPKPWISVLLGGSSGVYRFEEREAKELARRLSQLASESKGSLFITPSRRTSKASLDVLRAHLSDKDFYLWDKVGENPYLGLLALGDVILVTSDSVNMVTEAASTGKPVYILDLPGGSAKFARFHESMRLDNHVRVFTGRLENWQPTPLNAMASLASLIQERLQKTDYLKV